MARTIRWSVLVALVALVSWQTGPAFARKCKSSCNGNKAYNPVIRPASFEDADGDPLPIDNKYWPLVPGTTFHYEAVDEDETNSVTVTSDTKVIMGVTCVVVFDVEYEEDLLTEKTWDWYAQDKCGNVWYFGEYSEAYEYDDDGNLVDTSTEGSWEAGVDGALPGIVMKGNPSTGDCYRQEYYEDEAEDMAKILRLNARVSTDFGSFKKCLKTKEWTPLERGVIEHKYYAPGVGLVLINELTDKKIVELVEIEVE